MISEQSVPKKRAIIQGNYSINLRPCIYGVCPRLQTIVTHIIFDQIVPVKAHLLSILNRDDSHQRS